MRQQEGLPGKPAQQLRGTSGIPFVFFCLGGVFFDSRAPGGGGGGQLSNSEGPQVQFDGAFQGVPPPSPVRLSSPSRAPLEVMVEELLHVAT